MAMFSGWKQFRTLGLNSSPDISSLVTELTEDGREERNVDS